MVVPGNSNFSGDQDVLKKMSIFYHFLSCYIYIQHLKLILNKQTKKNSTEEKYECRDTSIEKEHFHFMVDFFSATEYTMKCMTVLLYFPLLQQAQRHICLDALLIILGNIHQPQNQNL